MSPDTLLLSGWGTDPSCFFPDLSQSKHYDYLVHSTIKAVEQDLLHQQYQTVIGWSLGGQLACHLLSSRIISAKKLILLATSPRFPNDEAYEQFSNIFQNNPRHTQQRFLHLISKGHPNPRHIVKQLKASRASSKNLSYWLSRLTKLSPLRMPMENFPTTLLYYADQDAVIPSLDIQTFCDKLLEYELFSVQNCGHAIHIEYQSQIEQQLTTA